MTNKLFSNYLQGVCWFILSLISSVVNDLIAKYSGQNLPVYEVAFLRFAFSALTLVPFIIYFGKSSIKSSRPMIHIIRGVILFAAITIWIQGLSATHVATATLISFTIPLFTLPLAYFFLDENVTWQRVAAAVIGFVGIAIIINPSGEDFNPVVSALIVSAIFFSLLDIINKKFIIQESMLSMLFYSALVTAVISLFVAYPVWVTPSMHDLSLFFILGCSSNLILFFILKAFAKADATALAPYRYLELIFSTSFGYIIFEEIPRNTTWFGAAIIIPVTLFIAYSEKK